MSGGGGGDNKVKPSKQEKELARIADLNWVRYKRKFVPVEDAFIQKVMGWGSEQEAAKVRGQTAAGIRRMMPSGAPTGGPGTQFGEMMNRNTVRSNMLGTGIPGANDTALDRHLAGVQQILAQGRNLKDQHRINLGANAASQSALDRQTARIGAYEDQNEMYGYGVGAGIIGNTIATGIRTNWGQAPQSTGAPYVAPHVRTAASSSGGGFASRPEMGL